MKKFILIIFTFLIWSQKPAISGEVAMIGVVDGMICLDCQKKVTKELKAATGENDINVSWQEGVAFINFSGSTSFTEKDFKEKKQPIDYRRSGVLTLFIGIGLFLLGYVLPFAMVKGIGLLVGAIGVGQIIAGYLYPNDSAEITKAVESFEKI